MGRWGYETIDDYADIRNQMGRNIATATNKYDVEAEKEAINAETNQQYADTLARTVQAYAANRAEMAAKAKAKALEDAVLKADAVNKMRGTESLGGESPAYLEERAKIEAAFADDPDAKKPGFLKRIFRTPTAEDYKDEARQKFKALTALQTDTQEQRNNQGIVKSLGPSAGIKNDWTLDNVGDGGGLATGARILSPLEQGTFESASMGEVSSETADLMRKAAEKETYELGKQRKLLEGTEAEAAAALNFDKHYDESMFINREAFLKAQVMYTDSGGNQSSLTPFLKKDLTPEQILAQNLDLENTRLSIESHRASLAAAKEAAAGGMTEKDLKKETGRIDSEIDELKKRIIIDKDPDKAAGLNQYIGILEARKNTMLAQADLKKSGIQGAVVERVLPDKTIIFTVKDPETKQEAKMTFNPETKALDAFESKRREGMPGTISGEGVEPSTGWTKAAEYAGFERATKPAEQGYALVPDFSVFKSSPAPVVPPVAPIEGFSPAVSSLLLTASPLEVEAKLRHMYAQGQVHQDEMLRALKYAGR